MRFCKNKKRIYLDYASTTPLDKDVFKKMEIYFKKCFGNPSSMYESGRIAQKAISEARKDIAKIINSSEDEVFFTGSGTESDNLAIFGVAEAYKEKGNHIIISAIEHKAVFEPAEKLKKLGFEVTVLPVDEYGLINIEECIKNITPKTILISVMYANNEIGTIQPIQELSKAIKKLKDKNQFPILHTDACQASGYLTLNVKKLGVDLMTLNGSKMYGPKGVGILYKKDSIKINPIILGGGQEKNIRSGTENVPYIVGIAEALKKITKNKKEESERLIKLRDYFFNQLKENIPDIIINGHRKNRLPNNINISIPGVEGESAVLMLDKYGIEASTGSACSANDLKPSHVILALKKNAELAHCSLRFTLGKYSNKQELDYTISVLTDIVKKLKNISALATKK